MPRTYLHVQSHTRKRDLMALATELLATLAWAR